MDILKTIWLFVLALFALVSFSAGTPVEMVWKRGFPHYRYADGTLLPMMGGGDDAALAAAAATLTSEIRELSSKHATLFTAAKAIRDEFQGKDTPPEKATEYDRILKEADEVKVKLEKAITTAESDIRFKSHMDFARGGDGHVNLGGGGPGAGGDGGTKEIAGYKVASYYGEDKDGIITVDVGGKQNPIFTKEYLVQNSHIAKTMTPEYKDEFRKYLKGPDFDAKALTPSVDTAGGFLVPADFLARVIQRLPGVAVVEEMATIITTTRDMVRVPRVKKAAADATMYSSNVLFTMVGPAETTEGEGETEPVFESIDTQVWDAKMQTNLNRNLLADAAFDVTGYLAEEFRRAATLGKDDKFLTGDGLKKPIGIINDADVAVVNTGDANLLTADGLKDLFYTPPAQYHMGSTVALSLDALKEIRKLKDTQNRYLWEPGFPGGLTTPAPPTIEGHPYRVTDFLDTVAANNKPILFGNFTFYWIINRAEMSLQVLREVRARQNEDVYLAFVRFGGNVSVPEAFAVQQVAA